LPAFYHGVRNTLVADSLQRGTAAALEGGVRHRVVTLEGQVIEPSGTMSGGGQPQRGRIGQSVKQHTKGVSQLSICV
jgi:structural maintenance of chromosome 4